MFLRSILNNFSTLQRFQDEMKDYKEQELSHAACPTIFAVFLRLGENPSSITSIKTRWFVAMSTNHVKEKVVVTRVQHVKF